MKEKVADAYARLRKVEMDLPGEIGRKIYPDADNVIGKKLYRCTSSARFPAKDLEEWTITGISVIPKDRYKLYDYLGGWRMPVGRPTKKLVADAEEYIKKYISAPLDMFDLFFNIERTTTWKDSSGEVHESLSMTGERYNVETGFELFRGEVRVSLNPDDFAEKIARDMEEYEKYYAPREGYVACERCGKQVPENEAVKYKLIYQGYDQNLRKARVMSRIGTFCSGECAMNEQMSLEG